MNVFKLEGFSNSSNDENVMLSGGELVAGDVILDRVSELSDLKIEIATVERRIKELQSQIQEFMGDKTLLVDRSGNALVTWKFCEPRESIDLKSLKANMPEVYEAYKAESKPYRMFVVKPLKSK